MTTLQNTTEYAAPTSPGLLGVVVIGGVDLVAGQAKVIDLVSASNQQRISTIQSVCLDTSFAQAVVAVQNPVTRQVVPFPPRSYSWQQMLIKDTFRIALQCSVACTVTLAVSSAVIPPVSFHTLAYQSSSRSRVTEVAAATSATTILASDPTRRGASILNDADTPLWVLYEDGTPSLTHFSEVIMPGQVAISDFGYGGKIVGFWGAAFGGARVTEYF